MDSPEEIISTVLKKRTGPPSNGSNSDESEDNKPPKLPSQSSKKPSAVPLKTKEEATIKSYHFDMKLKPETVPTWDGNDNMLAKWIEKFGQLAATLTDIFRELRKIVPQRFTDSAKIWYYTIPPKDC